MPRPADPGGKRGAVEDDVGPQLPPDHCGLCGLGVASEEEEFISGTCSVCSTCKYHVDCVIEWLEIDAKSGPYNVGKAQKLKVYAAKRPAHQFHMQAGRCPIGLSDALWKVEGPLPSCPGRFLAAELIKQRATTAPPPQPPPKQQHQQQPKPKQQQQPKPKQQQPKPAGGAGTLPRAGKPRGGFQPPPRSNSERSSSSLAKQGSGGAAQQVPAAAPALGSQRDRLGVLQPAPGAAAAAPKKQGRRQGRPDRLRMCPTWEATGVCGSLLCEFAHGEEELAAREEEWREQQARAKEEQRLREQEAATGLSEGTFSFMKGFKISHCTTTLISLGFGTAHARAAAEATAGMLEAAAELLTSGEPVAREDPSKRPLVVVCGEAAQLLAAAAELGYDAAAVEAQLQEHRGDWHAAGDALRRLARGQGGAAPSAGDWPATDEGCAFSGQGGAAPSAGDWPATDEGCAFSGQADAGGWQDSEAGAVAADAAAYFPGALPSMAGASSGSVDVWAQLIAAAKGGTPVLPGSSQGGGSGRGSSLDAAPPNTPELENFGPHTIIGNATSPGETEQLGAFSPPLVLPYCVAMAASAPASRPGSAPPPPAAATAEYSEGYQAGVSAMMAHLGLAPATPAAAAAPAADVDWGALLGGGGGGTAVVWGGPAAGAPAGAPANTWQQEGVQGAMPSQQPLEEELQDMLAMLCGGG